MNNKLSELSKPVVWPNGCNETAVNALRYLAENKRPIGGSDMYNTEHLYMIASELTRIANKPLYSQEYVSALDKAAQFWIGESAGWKQRAEDAEKRIAELELDELAMRASSRAVHEAQENHINQQQDIIESLEKKNVDLGRALGAAEKRLAAPVRLPDPSQDKWLQWSGDYNFRSVAYFSAVKKAVRAAGFTFTVEGDE